MAGLYDQTIPFFKEFGRQLVDWTSPRSSDRVLDAACGRGAIAVAAANLGCDVVAIDASPEMIRAVSAEFPGIDASVMDLQSLDFPDAEFDVVYCGFAMHLVDKPYQAVQEIWRILKPGGRFAFSRPAPYSGSHRWQAVRRLRDAFMDQAHGYTSISNGLRGSEVLTGFAKWISRTAEVHIPLTSPEQYWDWAQSHGSKAFIAALTDEGRHAYRQRVLAEVANVEPLVLDQAAQFWSATKQ